MLTKEVQGCLQYTDMTLNAAQHYALDFRILPELLLNLGDCKETAVTENSFMPQHQRIPSAIMSQLSCRPGTISPYMVKSVLGTGTHDFGKTSLISWTVLPKRAGYCSVTKTGISNAAAPLTCHAVWMSRVAICTGGFHNMTGDTLEVRTSLLAQSMTAS